MVKVEIDEKELEALKSKASRLEKFELDLENHMGPFNEEADEFKGNEGVDLCTIEEFTLNYFNAWR